MISQGQSLQAFKETAGGGSMSRIEVVARKVRIHLIRKLRAACPVTPRSGLVLAMGMASVLAMAAVRPVMAAAAEQVRMASGLGFSTFDPVLATPPTVDYLRPVYDTLVVRRGIDVFVPGLATEWQYSDENKALTLTLRQGVRFTDGTDFDGAAVKANFERGQRTAGSPWSAFYQLIDHIQVLEKYKLRLSLKVPNPALVEYLSTNPGMMVSPKALADPATLAFGPVGTGGWLLDQSQSVRGDRYTYVRNESYWNPDEQPVNTVVIRQMTDSAARVNALRTGQIDVAAITQTQGDALEKLGFKVMPTNMVLYMVGIWDADGTVVPALKNPQVREAIRLAINRKAVLKVIFSDRGTFGLNFYPKGASGHSQALEELTSHDLSAAKELMAKAGYESGFDVDTVVQTNNARLAEVIAGELAKIGVRLNVTVMPDVGSFHVAVHQKKSPVGIYAHQMALPLSLYSSLMHPKGRYNPFEITHEKMDAVIDEAARSDEKQAAALYAQVFESIVGEQAIVIPIVNAQILAAMRKGISAGATTYTDAGLPNPRYLEFTEN